MKKYDVVGIGNATITMAQNEKDTGNTVTEAMVGTGVGVSYAVSDAVKLTAYSASGDDDKDTAYEMTDTGVGISYTVTPGMVLHVTHNDQDLKNSMADHRFWANWPGSSETGKGLRCPG